MAGVAAAVAVFTLGVRVNATTVGFVLLLVVLATATARGLAAAAVVSGAAMLSLNFFFLPPVGQFTIAEPENWVALFTFLATALVASHLSGRAQEQAARARSSQRETEQLYALSRAILLREAGQPIAGQAAQSIAQIYELPSVLLFDAQTGEVRRGGPQDPDPEEQRRLEALLRDAARQGQRQSLGAREILPVALGGRPIGALAASGLRATDGARQSMVNLVAIALERVRTEEAARRAEAARQSEEFKSTLLDAMAHEFKTPLTSIKAAATGLRMSGTARPPDEGELLAVIEEEADRLSRLVTEAVKIAEIDAKRTAPRKSGVAVRELFEQTRQSFAGRGADRLETEGAGELEAQADRELIVLALRQFSDNALKYSGAETRVRYTARREGGRVVLRVTDKGPGIAESERERIFEKFQRGAAAARVPGTGMGLHIAREIARMHGGEAWVEAGAGGGAVFCLALPAGEGNG